MKVINMYLISQIDFQIYCNLNQNLNLNGTLYPRQGGSPFPNNFQDLL